jgi:hypothetical protein
MNHSPPDFRWRFRRIVEETFFQTRRSMHDFRDACDFDGFLEITATQCVDERHLALAFLLRFLPHLTPVYAETVALATVTFLSKSLGRPELDPADQLAARALLEMQVINEEELTKWLVSYY